MTAQDREKGRADTPSRSRRTGAQVAKEPSETESSSIDMSLLQLTAKVAELRSIVHELNELVQDAES